MSSSSRAPLIPDISKSSEIRRFMPEQWFSTMHRRGARGVDFITSGATGNNFATLHMSTSSEVLAHRDLGSLLSYYFKRRSPTNKLRFPMPNFQVEIVVLAGRRLIVRQLARGACPAKGIPRDKSLASVLSSQDKVVATKCIRGELIALVGSRVRALARRFLTSSNFCVGRLEGFRVCNSFRNGRFGVI